MVTLRQFVKVLQAKEAFGEDESRLNNEILKIFGLDKLKKQDSDKKMVEMTNYLHKEVELVKTFTLNGIEFGFIPNLNNITTGEFIDLEHYNLIPENYHKIMSILYRPIINKYKDLYEIEPYMGTDEFEDLLLESDVSIFNSAVVFFYNLSKDLLAASSIYIQNEQKN